MPAVFFLQKPLPCERGLLCPGLPWLYLLQKTVSPTAGLSQRLKGCSVPPWHHLLSSPISISDITWKNKMLQVLCCFRYCKEISSCTLMLHHITWEGLSPVPSPISTLQHATFVLQTASSFLCTDPRCSAGRWRALTVRLLPPHAPQVKLVLWPNSIKPLWQSQRTWRNFQSRMTMSSNGKEESRG